VDIVEFLRARLDEDERTARAADVKQGDDPEWKVSPVLAARIVGQHGALTVRSARDNRPVARVESCGDDEAPDNILDGDSVGTHIARHDPARVLREVEAKRRIVDLHVAAHAQFADYGTPRDGAQDALDDVLRLLALPYSDHPDYRAEWAPG
jgi:hypothetical protein